MHEDLTRTYFTPNEVASHNSSQNDCWVSFLGRVYNLTDLILENKGWYEDAEKRRRMTVKLAGALIQPIADAAGKDISHWFDPKGDVKRHINMETGIEEYYTPMGRFLHIPPSDPSMDFNTDFDLPWWKDHESAEPKYWVGMLSKKTRMIRIVNMLTKDEHTVEVCSEDILEQIQSKYLMHNKHAASYTWKRLPRPGVEKEMVVLDMKKTLEQNGVVDESEEFEELGLDDDYFIPSLHLYYKDDLTVA
ncbi:hypothetical protein GUITHDRAFT_88327 [Guillardia theta CCMP2712]|uniref:Cytochrome b5 domain-containing protein 1 n=1 Tax=Guillardia theta (strain CCMP2712) TaxID=905079 RepID=L1J141_GUITC|nr:hypothetical protein GUITHDRAFT_88327 [Guillardia theta CCMP2712]EKX41785.1 hypothetical protein GUITHDRAFT_88327 [Guillardia theta CCMP2712]|eukprot:XP_005828765.1 hypothetical protein GUITHDRAFT_88327 [Guillardia theta CCMP2712]